MSKDQCPALCTHGKGLACKTCWAPPVLTPAARLLKRAELKRRASLVI